MAKDPRVRHHFQLLEIDIADVDVFYQLMIDMVGTDELDIELFVAGCVKMMGSASSADMQAVLFQTKMLKSEIAGLSKQFETRTRSRASTNMSIRRAGSNMSISRSIASGPDSHARQ